MKAITELDYKEVRLKAYQVIKALNNEANNLSKKELENLQKSLDDLLQKYGTFHSDPDFLKR